MSNGNVLLTNGAFLALHRYKPKNEHQQYEVLITRSKRGHGVLPGGQVEYSTEMSEPYRMTALREAEEEIGFKKPDSCPFPIQTSVPLIAVFQQRIIPPPVIRNAPDGPEFIIGTVCLYAHHIPGQLEVKDLTLDRDEVAEARWVELFDAILDIGSAEGMGLTLATRRMLIAFRLSQEHPHHPQMPFGMIEGNLGNPWTCWYEPERRYLTV